MGYNVEYIPTGFVYELPKEEADRLITEEPENFRVVDKDYKAPEVVEEKQEETILEQVKEKEEKPKKQTKKQTKK